MIQSSYFRQLAYLITVGDICSNFLATFDVNQVLVDVWEEWYDLCANPGIDPYDQLALVARDQEIQGWIGFDMLEFPKKTMSDCMERIEPNAIMTADTSLVDAVKAFSTSAQPLFLILKGNKFIGWLSYKDLHKPPFRLCLFAMLINLERVLLNALLVFPAESVALLSKRRLDKAKKTYQLRAFSYGPEGEPFKSKLLECTTLWDKINITRQIPDISGSVHALGNVEWLDKIEPLRNEIAHSSIEEQSSWLLKREQLWVFIQWVESLESEMEIFLAQAKMVKGSAHG